MAITQIRQLKKKDKKFILFLAMTKNPLINAITAGVYIVVVSAVMFYGTGHVKGNSIIGPIAILSLFTLSASIMGYIFLYQPLQLYLDGKKKKAIDLFLTTVLAFGAITALALLLLFSGILS